MRRSILFCALAIAACATSARADADDRQFYGSTHFKLSNGLEVVIVPIPKAPIVHMQITYRVGSDDEEPGKTGLAHYMEHLMFRAGQKEDPGHLQFVAQAGGQVNAFTTQELTSYFNEVPLVKFAETLAREAARMARLDASAEGAVTEIGVVLREMAIGRDRTANRLYDRLYADLWGRDPRGHLPIGNKDEVDHLTLEDARAFHDRWYSAANAQLVVTGNLDLEATRDLVKKDFDALPRHAVPARRWQNALPSPPAETSFAISGADVASPSLHWAWLIDFGSVPATSKQRAAIQVALAALTGYADSRLSRALIYDDPLAAAVGIYGGPGAGKVVEFRLDATPLDPAEIDLLEARLLTQIAQIRESGLTDEEISRTKQRLRAGFETAFDKPAPIAQAFVRGFASGLDAGQVEALPHEIDAIPPQEINRALRRILAMEGVVKARLMPKVSASQ